MAHDPQDPVGWMTPPDQNRHEPTEAGQELFKGHRAGEPWQATVAVYLFLAFIAWLMAGNPGV